MGELVHSKHNLNFDKTTCSDQLKLDSIRSNKNCLKFQKKTQIIILHSNDRGDIQGLLPSNQNLIFSILFNKPFAPFQEMPDDLKAKLRIILDEVNFSIKYRSMNNNGIRMQRQNWRSKLDNTLKNSLLKKIFIGILISTEFVETFRTTWEWFTY